MPAAEPEAAVHVDAPAKINLALHVTGRRSDGYHLIETLVVFATFGDRIVAGAADRDRFSIRGPFVGTLDASAPNLVTAARDALREGFSGARCPPVFLELEKNLPVASGVGGGSSDAAATLIALARLWRLPTSTEDLSRIGAALGADVPMCLVRRPLAARGIGERIEPVGPFPALPLVLVNPKVPVATPAVFAGLAHRENPPLPPLADLVGPETVADWLRMTRNDLEDAAIGLAPVIDRARGLLDDQGALIARMSGSGATCFGLFASMEEAWRAQGAIAAAEPTWFVVATRSLATED